MLEPMASLNQLAANRANAQLSTGPISQYEKDEAELKRRIAEREKAAKDRRTAENRRWQNAIDHYRTAREYGIPFDPAEIGFEFSTEEIAAREQQIQVKAAIQNGRYYEYKKKGYLKVA
jgi:hypothetical protein